MPPIPTAMTAVILKGTGDLDQLQLAHNIPTPQPITSEVLIQVGACGLNNTDVNLRLGWYAKDNDAQAQSGWKRGADQFPVIQGADVAGTIVAVGKNVSERRIGERVLVNPTIYLSDYDTDPTAIDYLGSERNGGYAQYVVVPAQNAHTITANLTDIELATFSTSYLTAEHMIASINTQAGETVLVTGASGGVGSALVQLLKVRGVRVAALVGTGKEKQAHDLGADIVVNRHAADIETAIRKALDGNTLDAVTDVVGGANFNLWLTLMRPGGRLVTAGAIAGPLVEIDLRTLYLKHQHLTGSTLGTQADFANLVRHINHGQLRPLVAATYPLDRLPQAQTAFLEKKHFGKFVIVP